MEHQRREEAPQRGTSSNTPAEQDLTRATNPDPRANENLEGDDLEDGAAEGVGSEITDGEAS